MTNEAVFSYIDQLTNEGVRLNSSAITDFYIFLNFNKRADKNITTYFAPIEVDRINYCYVTAEINIYDSNTLALRWTQDAVPSRQCFG